MNVYTILKELVYDKILTIVDYILYYKILIQNNFYYKSLMDYYFYPNYIKSVELYDGDITYYITNIFTNMLSNNNVKWDDIIDLLSLDTTDVRIEIQYYINEKYYRVNYNYGDNIIFPLYQPSETINYDIDYYKRILSAECDGEDITEIIREYAGPLGDFYEGKGHKMLLKNIIKGKELKITNILLNEYTYKNNEELIWKK